ncbi:MAG: diacylglycerol kinase family protein [Meiothermus sp.]|uniref:diacylglycerol kinase n=1 Tax=Meiothermus sp. TaxID=1955249 RepID=UPI0025E3543F|nr:diacylglycerol kinase family protein [Meiothermus sp.]MCS7057978.1 diacylglycerol kinase family protein [Meiothermus sp.]MCS7194528.1 diacylglycerol kinase family protein [Meiothermus sp.]MCX7740488.1 diacylglycerol kinase family protein [Meiothermus sp.]MDW8091884.1 diacylglycerol kinase family protein [Meiothermus sp.]MDW8480873.1 diacylglycerol kinase family protein [Meiothermus sp.]
MPVPSPSPKPSTDPLPLRGLKASFTYAWAGLRFAWKSQRNFRLEVYIAALALGLALWLEVSLIPVLFLVALVLGLELLNTALEALVDLVSPHYHPLAKAAKDVAAAGVLLVSGIAALIGLMLFLPPLVARLGLW